MITREQVADLRPGDVVEIAWPNGAILHGPLYEEDDHLDLGPLILRYSTGGVGHSMPSCDLTVVSRAPRLYVNHDRAEPVQGDVVRFIDTRRPDDAYTNVYDNRGDRHRPWLQLSGERWTHDQVMPRDCLRRHYRLELLVDGETGQVVP